MFKKNIKISGIKTGHIQGIATDQNREYMYYSFTTCLIKTDMEGNIIGSVKGLAGHLGCIAYNYDDNRVYGSLEYKHDCIGASILERINSGIDETIDVSDGFYIAIFDVDKINRMDMDAEKDGIMTAVHLSEVLADYNAKGHKYCCSGIDGVTFAPTPGDLNSKKYLYVAYGIYGDNERDDNDHQVILRYDITHWAEYEKSLNQSHMHKNGPEKPDSKYFVYTGNTTFGIQNLEYDEETGLIFAAVYRGKKTKFPNYPMYVIDMKKPSEHKELKCLKQTGDTLALAEIGIKDDKTGIYGIEFPYGATGIISLGGGDFYFSEDFHNDDGWGSVISLYKFNGKYNFIKA